jgi:hypothetical protein
MKYLRASPLKQSSMAIIEFARSLILGINNAGRLFSSRFLCLSTFMQLNSNTEKEVDVINLNWLSICIKFGLNFTLKGGFFGLEILFKQLDYPANE